MSDEVQPGPGWKWVTIGIEVDGDSQDPGGADVVVPSRLRVIRSAGGRPTMRVDISVLPTPNGRWKAAVTGVEFFGDEAHPITHTYRSALKVDSDVDGFVRQSMRVLTPAPVEGDGFKADRRAWEAATYEPVDPANVGVRAAVGNVRPAGRAVAQGDKARALDDEVRTAAHHYKVALRLHLESGESGKPRPTVYVERTMGLSRRTAARRIEEARRRGLLPETSRGKVQG